jgi:hypothetical protein
VGGDGGRDAAVPGPALMRLWVVTVVTTAALAAPAPARAQGWVPAAGTGTITFSSQSVDHTGHRLTDGTYIDNGRSRTAAAAVDVEYGLTGRWAVGFSVPYVFARYTDDGPTPFIFRPVDRCRCWHSGWQDLGFTARLRLVDTFDHVLIVTPTLAAGTPSHDYAYQGEAVIGRQLNELRLGAEASYRLDAVSRNVTISGRYTYAFVQKVIDVSTNRSNASAALDYRIGHSWSVGAFLAWQRTHGGLRAGSLPPSAFPVPGDINTPDRIAEHDRLLRDNRTHVGAQASCRVGQADVFGSFTYFATGTDTHAGWAVIAGIAAPFRIRH